MPERMHSIEQKLVRSSLVVGIAATLWCLGPASENANSEVTGGCHGSGCTGLDPTNRCDGDAETVASIAIVPENMHAYAGQLDLRYSESCEANWARFTAAQNRGLVFSLFKSNPQFPFGRVTVWNSGESSQSAVEGSVRSGVAGTSWTAMVDGTKEACTGVEIYYAKADEAPTEKDSVGWTWGPCR
jgi:hypothetical protein